VRVDLVLGGLPADRFAQTEFRRLAPGVLEARIKLPTPLRDEEYAESLAHELEHVLEQVEGLDLDAAAEGRRAGVARLADGVFESERARRVGRQAALEVGQGGR
jgi:hypothetical protein